MPDVFVADALALAVQREPERPIRSLAQAEAIIRQECFDLNLLILRDGCADKPPTWPWEQGRLHLLRIAAAAIQAARQLGLDSRQDAIAKEIPF